MEEEKPKLKGRGGAGRGGGRKKGQKDPQTLEKERVMEAFRQKAMAMANTLLMAQTQEALGTYSIIRKDLITNSKGKVIDVKFVTVEDPKEMEMVMNEFQEVDGKGEIDGIYYMIVREKPNHKASEAILNRTFGKPTETIDLGNKENQPFIIKLDS